MNGNEKNINNSKKWSPIIIGAAVILIVGLLVMAVLVWRLQSQVEMRKKAQLQILQQSRETQVASSSPASEKNDSQGIVEVSSLSFEPQAETVAVNDSFALSVIADPKGKKISATELHVSFDPKVLKIESITPSDVFSLVLSDKQIDNEKGTASIVLAVPLQKPSVDVVSQVAIFNFKALSSASRSSVSFSEKSIAAADGETTNVIASRMPAVITVR